MLKLSFNFKNIQNPLQRHYYRGQTVLSFEQNLIEDEIKIKIIVKDNMGQTVLSFNQTNCFDQNSKLLLCFLVQILLKDKRVESDQIKLALLQEKWLKLPWKDNTGQTILSQIQIS